MQKTKILYNGQTIEVPDFHAKRLVAAGRATLPGSGTYQRRDMQAVDPQRDPAPSVESAPQAKPESAAEAAPETGKAAKRAAKKADKRTNRRTKGEGN